MKRAAAAALFACMSALARAQSPAPAGPLDVAPGLLQTTLGLALVLALIVGGAWLLRRVAPAGRAGTPIKVISTQSVGQRERVVLIEVGDEWLLLGVAPGAVRMLHALPKGAPALATPVPATETPFARLLAAARGGKPR